MTLDEAIIHAKEVSNTLCNSACGIEHMQLAKWLEELRILKSALNEILAYPLEAVTYTSDDIKRYITILLMNIEV